jgi:hypothetical protein
MSIRRREVADSTAEAVPDDSPPPSQLPSDDHFFSWLRRHAGKPPATVTVDQVIQAVAKKMGVDRKRLLSTSRERRLTLTRALIGWHVTKNQIATLTEVSRQLGRTRRASIPRTRAIGRGGRSSSGIRSRPSCSTWRTMIRRGTRQASRSTDPGIAVEIEVSAAEHDADLPPFHGQFFGSDGGVRHGPDGSTMIFSTSQIRRMPEMMASSGTVTMSST